MMPVSKCALAALATVSLAGCSTVSELNPFETKRVEYRSAQSALRWKYRRISIRRSTMIAIAAGTSDAVGRHAQSRAAALSGAGGVLPAVTGMRVINARWHRTLAGDAGHAGSELPAHPRFWGSMNDPGAGRRVSAGY